MRGRLPMADITRRPFHCQATAVAVFTETT
jgi:hypothetical protein